MASTERFSSQFSTERSLAPEESSSWWESLAVAGAKVESLWVSAKEAVRLIGSEFKTQAYTPDTYFKRATREWKALRQLLALDSTDLLSTPECNSAQLQTAFITLNQRLGDLEVFERTVPQTADSLRAVHMWYSFTERLAAQKNLPTAQEIRDTYWMLSWWSRFWHDFHQIGIEFILRPHRSQFEYLIENGTMSRGGYSEPPAELAQNTIDHLEGLDFNSSRAVADGETWTEMYQWMINGPVNAGYTWTSPPGDRSAGYLGTRANDKKPGTKEIYRSRIFFGVKTSAAKVLVTQYDAYPSQQDLIDFQQELGQPVHIDETQPLATQLVRNLIKHQFNNPDEITVYQQKLESSLYKKKKRWLKRPHFISDDQLARFEKEMATLAKEFYLPKMTETLNNSLLERVFDQSPDEARKLLTDAKENNTMDSTLSIGFGAMSRWLKEYFKNPQKVHSFSDKIKLKDKDGNIQEVTMGRAIGIATASPNLFGSFLKQFVTHGGGFFECMAISPFTTASQLGRISMNGTEMIQVAPGRFIKASELGFWTEGNCVGCGKLCTKVRDSLCQACNSTVQVVGSSTNHAHSHFNSGIKTAKHLPRGFNAGHSTFEELFSVNVFNELKGQTSAGELVSQLI